MTALLGPLILSGCLVTDTLSSVAPEETGPRVSTQALKAADPQSRIGAEQHPRILASHGGAYESPKLASLMAVVAADLVAQQTTTGDGTQPGFSITVLDSGDVNAFALPGGYLYVTRGLVALANDAAEIAAVLAHEMAHVSADHGVERIARTRASDVATRAAVQVVGDGVVGEIARSRAEQKLASFSRAQELQADVLGIKLAGQAGFDAYGASRFLAQMRRWSEYSAGGSGSVMLATHPSTPQRLALAKSHARRFGPEGSGRRMRERYLEGVDGLPFGDGAERGRLTDRRYSNAKSRVRFDLPSGFKGKVEREALIADGAGDVALRYDTAERAGASDPAAYMASGWVNGLDARSIETRTVAGAPAAVARARAGGFDFAVAVVAVGERFHRFIAAVPEGALQRGVKANEAVLASFTGMTRADAAAVTQLRVDVVLVGAGDSVASLAKRMATGGEPLFRTLNALGAKGRVKPGTSVKIVAG